MNNVNYTLHELTALPINIGIFLIPAEVIAGVIVYVIYRKMSGKAKVNAILRLSAFISLLIFITAASYFLNGGSHSGVEDNVQAYEVNYTHYIKLNEIPLKITEQQYNLIHNGESYSYTYEYRRWMGKDIYKLSYLKILDESSG